jgi:outer membrane protein OmpA-like peptidoglycan-associated protein
MKKILLLTAAALISLSTARAQEAQTMDKSEQHRIFAYFGMGYASSMYNGMNHSFLHRNYSFSSAIEAKYAYFFTPRWGASLGLGLSRFAAKGTLNIQGMIPHYNDPDFDINNEGRFYDLYYSTTNLVEKQQIWALEVPLLGHFEHFFNSKYGIFASAGFKGYFPFISARSLFSQDKGTVTTYGYEAYMKSWYADAPHFGRREARTTPAPASLRISIDAVAEFGGLLRLSPIYDLYLGLYGGFGFFNVLPKDKIEFISAEPNNSFAVNSLLASNVRGQYNKYVKDYNLDWGTVSERWTRWQIGVKVGVHIKPCKIGKIQKDRSLREAQKDFYDKMPEAVANSAKTVVIRDTVHVVYVYPEAPAEDALTKAEKESIDALTKILNRHKILFDLDSDKPKVEDKNFISGVIAILQRTPSLSMIIEGYTCDLGTEAHNRDLAARRAKAIRNMFTAQGANPAQVQIAAFTTKDPETNINIKDTSREGHRAVIFKLIKECR